MNETRLNDYWKQVIELVAKGKKSEAIFLLRRMVKEGSLSALAEIGNLYELPSNETVKQDFRKAAAYYRKSIELSEDKYAYLSLARLHLYGCGVDRDFNKARLLLVKASEQNLCIADLFLGRIYRHGYGVKQNIKKSDFYYDQAIHKGSVIALKEKGWLTILDGKLVKGIPIYLQGLFKTFLLSYADYKEYGVLVNDGVKEQ